MTKRLVKMKPALIVLCIVMFALAGCARRASEQSRQNSVSSPPPIRVSGAETDAAEPSLVAAPDATIYIAWVEHRPNRQADVFVAHLDAEGRSLGGPTRVNPQAGGAKAWHGDPPTLAVAPDRTLYVGWTARHESQTSASILYLSSSHDEGRSFAPPVKVNDDTRPASHGMHSLAVGPSGHVYIAWLDERNVKPEPMPVQHEMNARPQQHEMNAKPMELTEPNSELFFSVSTDGGRTFSKNQRVSKDVCPCCKTALVAGPDNQIYVAWRQVLPGDFRHIAVASSADEGRSFTEPRIVSDDEWKITGCPVSGPSLALDGDGMLRVLWFTAGERGLAGLYWAQSNDRAQTFTARRLLAQGQVHGNPHLLADAHGDLLAVWQNDDEQQPRVMSARLSADATANEAEPASVIATAELPSPALAGTRLVVSYIVNIKDARAIWLAGAQQEMKSDDRMTKGE